MNWEEISKKYIKQTTSYIDVKKLTKWDVNPRKITQQGIDNLKHKISKYPAFFYARPILANFTGDDNNLTVFAGNQRLEAALRLDYQQVPVIIFNNLPEEMQKEMAIIDNHNDGEWDIKKLELNFKEINFSSLGLIFNFETPKFEAPNIVAAPADNETTKQEQANYPVSNEAPQQCENSTNEDPTRTIKVKCPHCGEEFDCEI